MTSFQTSNLISSETDVVFVSDLFVEEYCGGAELTSEALKESSLKFKIQRVHAKDVNIDVLRSGHTKYWIFGNATQLDPNLIPTIIGNLRYSILEYDYKYCQARSPEKHRSITGKECDCDQSDIGKLISAWFFQADTVFWMSEGQRDHYISKFPFLADKVSTVLNSVFSLESLKYMKRLRKDQLQSEKEREGWIVLGSKSWIKGFDDAVAWCQENNKHAEIVWDLPYNKVLEKLSKAEGFVYLPRGMDTCPRMTIEAKLLGCRLKLNSNVQHNKEEWFNESVDDIERYLMTTPSLFWNVIEHNIDKKVTISGYTTTRNCIRQKYPFEQSIKSMLEFCDEVCVVDLDSDDFTWERLLELAYPGFENILTKREDSMASIKFVEDMRAIGVSPYQNELPQSKIRLKSVRYDWSDPSFALFDGQSKAEARLMCTSDFCWQMDCDEIVHEDDCDKIKRVAKSMTKDVDLVALPVIEYWGGPEKVRVDVNPWKWRLSRNKKNITHGIPLELRKRDASGRLLGEGSDGCDYIDTVTHRQIPFITFYNGDVEQVRRKAFLGDETALKQYEEWYNSAIDWLPSVFHYSWYDISRKMKLYRDYWQSHWNSISGKNNEDTAENNMMFDVPWSEVTDEMIEERAKEFKEKMSGNVWHKKWDGRNTPGIICNRSQPKVMK